MNPQIFKDGAPRKHLKQWQKIHSKEETNCWVCAKPLEEVVSSILTCNHLIFWQIPQPSPKHPLLLLYRKLSLIKMNRDLSTHPRNSLILDPPTSSPRISRFSLVITQMKASLAATSLLFPSIRLEMGASLLKRALRYLQWWWRDPLCKEDFQLLLKIN